MNERLFAFAGGETGAWHVTGMHTVSGEPLLSVKSITVLNGLVASMPEAHWILHGVTSHDRYVRKDEKQVLVSIQEGLGRLDATHAALIPIRKNPAWWLLTQNERREILEERSHHIQIGMRYLPAIARRLFHCRDIAINEPFDFLTWFEYSPAETPRFEDLLAQLRATHEWTYVDREIDIRLVGEPT